MGASRGIGAATARALAAAGMTTILTARAAEACAGGVGEICAAGGAAEALSCDVSSYGDVSRVVDEVCKRYGRIDVVVNNAGMMEPVGLTEVCDPQAWSAAIMVNLVGAFHGCRAVLPVFRETGRGVIVNLSTGAAFHPLVGWGAYCSAKAGLAMFTRVLGLELSGSDIKVYGFQPGMVKTTMTREALKKKVNRVAELDPEDFSDPEVPARAIAWLCRERPDDLSGGEVDINDAAFRARAGMAG